MLAAPLRYAVAPKSFQPKLKFVVITDDYMCGYICRGHVKLAAIRICRAYRTVSTGTASVLFRQVPWHLLARERAER